MTFTKKRKISYAITDEADIYPETDGAPLAETERHLRGIFRMLDILETHFAEDMDVYAWSNMMMYYEKGNPRAFVKPDIFVSIGIGKHERRIYKVWEEGKAPDFIMEFASKSTYHNDLGGKKDLYAELGVTEYFLFDPYRTNLPIPLMGFRLIEGVYVEIPPLSNGHIISETLNLEFIKRDDGIGVYDPASGTWLKTRAEQEAEARQQEITARQTAEARAQRETNARQKAEAELEKLREKLKRLEAESAGS